jgi:hypothetical protein
MPESHPGSKHTTPYVCPGRHVVFGRIPRRWLFFLWMPYSMPPPEIWNPEPEVVSCNGVACCRYGPTVPHCMEHEAWSIGRAAITRVRCRKCGATRTRPEWRRY